MLRLKLHRMIFRNQRGQSMVEFALVAIIFFFLVFGILEVGRLMLMNNMVAGAAREASHYKALHPEATVYSVTQEISPSLILSSPTDPKLWIGLDCPTCSTCTPSVCPDSAGSPLTTTVIYTWTTGVGLPFLNQGVVPSSKSTIGRER